MRRTCMVEHTWFGERLHEKTDREVLDVLSRFYVKTYWIDKMNEYHTIITTIIRPTHFLFNYNNVCLHDTSRVRDGTVQHVTQRLRGQTGATVQLAAQFGQVGPHDGVLGPQFHSRCWVHLFHFTRMES